MAAENSEKLLADLISINTVNGNEKAVADLLEKIFQTNGIKTQRLKYTAGRETLVAQVGTGKKPVFAFEGHEDTVAFGNLQKWEQSPLTAKFTAGKVFGRGASDMKSGLAAQVLALLALKKKESELPGTVKLFASVGEEVGGFGAKQIFEEHLADDVDGLVVGEPTGTSKDLLKKDFYMTRDFTKDQINELLAKNKLADQFFVITGHKGVFQYKVIAHGKSAHSSMPELGHNAIDDLIKYGQVQSEYFASLTAKNKLLGKPTPVVTLLSAGEQINTVPDRAEMSVNIRVIPEKDADSFEQDIQALIAKLNSQGMDLELKVRGKSSPVYAKSETSLAKLAKQIGEPLLEQELPYAGMSGGTDASRIIDSNPKMEIIVFGPGDISIAHQENEYVSLTAYQQFIKIYTELAVKFLESQAAK